MKKQNQPIMTCGKILEYINAFKAAMKIENEYERIQALNKLQRDIEIDLQMPVFNPKLLEQFRKDNPEISSLYSNIVTQWMEE